jgi:hypothetical protein
MGRPEHGSAWRLLQGVDQRALREARLEAHYAVQWLARTARAFVPPRPDDSHTNLGWDDVFGGFTTHPLPDGSRLGLALASLTLVLLDAGNGTQSAMALDGRCDGDVCRWLGDAARAKGLPVPALDAPSPYEMPPHAIARGGAYGVAALNDVLRVLAAWYANADLVLGDARRRLVARGIDAPPVRCWPHHFDLDTLVTFGAGEGARTTGLGFSPGDEYYDEPYFYVSLHPAPAVAALPPLPAIGHWHTRDFTAAVAPASRIVATKDQKAETEAFLSEAAEIAIKALR